MYYLRLVRLFAGASLQNELAYSANFWLSLLHSLLNLATGVLGLVVIFGQVEAVHGWNFASTLALLGVYLSLSALRGLVLGQAWRRWPEWTARCGAGGSTSPCCGLSTSTLASVRYWRPLALVDLALGAGVLGLALNQLGLTLTLAQLLTFALALMAAVTILYAILLAFTGLVFWSPGFLFTWVFDAFFQMARYPVGLYPGWLRLILTWSSGWVMTTVPAQALTGAISAGNVTGCWPWQWITHGARRCSVWLRRYARLRVKTNGGF
jgi:ABC-2 type transport system permease protein